MKFTPGIERLLKINEQHSLLFQKQQSERQLYRARYGTQIGVFKCMDGRIHLPVMTKTPLGLIRPWRNLGGQFDLGWPVFQNSVFEWVDYSTSIQQNCLAIITYHFSVGDRHRGCRGFEYDKRAAMDYALGLKRQFNQVFGGVMPYVIVCGIETDFDSLILHGENAGIVDLVNVYKHDDESVREILAELYPNMPEKVAHDFVPLVAGNIQHTAEVRASGRPIEDAEHREWVSAIGRGYDWLHKPNTALIVGPFHPDLSIPIATAAGLLLGNVKEGRTNGDGIVLMSAAPYREEGYRRQGAIEKAKYLHQLSRDVIGANVPELQEHLSSLVGVVNMHTRRFEPLDSN